jgi:hypothetical protein
VGLKLVCWHLKSILSQNVVRICTEHLSNSKRLGSHFEVNERFKSRCSLDGEIRIVKEAVIEDVTKLILHSDQLFNNLTVLQNFFDPERLSLRSVKLNLLEHSEAFGSDKFLEPHSNCLQTLWLIFIEFVEKFEIIISTLGQKFIESFSFIEELFLRLDEHLGPESLDDLVPNAPLKDCVFALQLLLVVPISLSQVVDQIGLVHDLFAFLVVK